MPAAEPLDRVPFESAPYRGLEHNPNITVVADVIFGGPNVEPNRDRRLYMEVPVLRQLLELAERSPTQRVVIEHAGFRLRRVRDGAHVVEVIEIIGTNPKPEPFSLAGSK